MRPSYILVVVIVGLLVLGTTTGVADDLIGGPTTAPRITAVVAQPDGPSATLVRDLAIFRRARDANDALGPAAGPYATDGPNNPGGIAPALSRRVRIGEKDFALWLAPAGPDDLCVLPLPPGAVAVGAQCDTLQNMSKGAQTLTYSQSRIFVYGIAPDGTESATLHLADGSTLPMVVRDNVYFAHATQPTVSVALTDEEGQVVSLPARSYDG